VAKQRKNPRKPTGKRVTTKQVQEGEDRPFVPPQQVPVGPEIDDDDPCGDEGLSIRRRLFVEYITGEALGNASRSAKLAGYSDSNRHVLDQTASRLLRFVEIQQAIARRLAAKLLKPEAIRARVAELAGATMANFLKVGADGKPEMDWPAAAAAGAIGQVREYTEEGVEGAGQPVVFKRKFKIQDPIRALELLAKVQGLINDRPSEPEEPPLIRMRPVNRVAKPDDAFGSN
jgi:hypothetical protein